MLAMFHGMEACCRVAPPLGLWLPHSQENLHLPDIWPHPSPPDPGLLSLKHLTQVTIGHLSYANPSVRSVLLCVSLENREGGDFPRHWRLLRAKNQHKHLCYLIHLAKETGECAGIACLAEEGLVSGPRQSEFSARLCQTGQLLSLATMVPYFIAQDAAIRGFLMWFMEVNSSPSVYLPIHEGRQQITTSLVA